MTHNPIKPKPLAPGQTIGLIAPASQTNEPERVRFALDIVESLGFRVKLGQHVYDRDGYFAGDDAARAADVNRMFADEAVDAIFCLRGGYGSARVLPLLDYELIRRNPKVLLGYSDITSLHQALYHRADLVTFHGPIASQTFTPYTLAEFKKVLLGHPAPYTIGSPPPFVRAEGRVEAENRLTRLVPGKVQGRLLGGNLCVLTHLIGTPYCPDFSGAILFLEDYEEAYYRLDRFLTQLWLAGVFDRIAGVVFGKFAKCTPSSNWLHNRSLEDILSEYPRARNVPALAGMMIGHVEDQTTVPVGGLAELDVEAGTLTLLESPTQ